MRASLMRAIGKRKRTRPGMELRARPHAPGARGEGKGEKGPSHARCLDLELTGAARGDHVYSSITYVCKYDIAHFDGGGHASLANGIHCLCLQR